MTRLLITGGTGFVGSACVRNALARGHEVHVIARSRGPVPGDAVPHDWDLLAAPPTELLHEIRPTHLLHLAWIATPGEYWTSNENSRWVEASLGLLSGFAASGGSRAVLVGTCAEYDWSGDGVLDETGTPLRPATPYGRAKDELRLAAQSLAQRRGFSLAWARLFFLYGPGEHPDRLVPYVIRQLRSGQPALCTEGTQRRDFLHVDDAADALLTLTMGEVAGPVNVASGTALPVRDLVAEVARLVGRPELVHFGAHPTPPGEPAELRAGVDRLRREVQWHQRGNWQDRLAETVTWWSERDDSHG